MFARKFDIARGVLDKVFVRECSVSGIFTTLPWRRQLEVKEKVGTYLQGLESTRWMPQNHRQRVQRLIAVLLLMTVLFLVVARGVRRGPYLPSVAEFPDIEILEPNVTTGVTQIPPKIWQIYLSFTPNAASPSQLHSWISRSPSHTYTILDAAGALAVVAKLAHIPSKAHVLPLFYAMSRRVLRADFLRYLVLAVEGGIYSDMDTEMVQPLREWVPAEFRDRTALVVGLEADRSPPIPGTTYEVQFCQWTMAGAKGHPVFWRMVDRILQRVRDRPYETPARNVDYSDSDILDVSGPAGWTEVIYEHLSKTTQTTVTWRNLTGLKEPRLIGDTLVLPIDGFATGVPHSNASPFTTSRTMVKHQFNGAWRDGHG